MDFKTALDLKSSISLSFLKSRGGTRSIVSFSAAASPRATVLANQVRSEVKAVGVSEKQSGENFIKVLKRKDSTLKAIDIARYYGVSSADISVESTDPIKFKMPTQNHRPPYPGISVGHYQITAGTLGCFVNDEKGKVYILSNNHVLANTNRGFYKDPILQPGKLDGGIRSRDVVAELSYLVQIERTKPNMMDAAIAAVLLDDEPIYLVNGKRKVSGTAEPVNSMKVEKFGRTTGHTKGKVTSRSMDLKVDFDGQEIEFQDQIQVKGNNGTMFCDGGDSGSLIFQSDTLRAVGLLFAGDDEGTTYASPIDEVLAAFSVKIL